jgi:NAD(P)-dependent dehydrogenase (short-subunit alcohol dehydrogenase family)
MFEVKDRVAFVTGGAAGLGLAYVEVPAEHGARVVLTDIDGVFATVQAAAIHMQAQLSGRIIVTSSIGGMKSEPLTGYAYASTKAAINNLVRHAATELAQYDVLVNAIAPGPFYTNIANGRLQRDPEVVKQFEELVPLHRIGRPAEIKGLALFLASDASSYLTGAVIPIDCGATAW